MVKFLLYRKREYENMEEVMKQIKEFNEERDWDKFHSPENFVNNFQKFH